MQLERRDNRVSVIHRDNGPEGMEPDGIIEVSLL